MGRCITSQKALARFGEGKAAGRFWQRSLLYSVFLARLVAAICFRPIKRIRFYIDQWWRASCRRQRWITGVVMSAAVFLVIVGGIKSIANAEKIVPFMAVCTWCSMIVYS